MTDPRLEDHVVGLELQLVELVEQKQRAEVQGRPADAAELQAQIDALQLEMATSAERLAAEEGTVPDLSAPTAAEV